MISRRLFHIAKMIDQHDCCADIGADHGKLVLFLANKYKNSIFLAVENKTGPFQILKNAVNLESRNSNIECSLSDGIEYLNDNINTLIFAGMGGYNVIDIIKKDYKNLKFINKIVICVNKKVIELLDFLQNIGFRIENSDAVEDADKIYLIFSLMRTDEKNTNLYSDSIKNVKHALISSKLYEKYMEKILLNLERERNAKLEEELYEYSDSYLQNYLLNNVK